MIKSRHFALYTCRHLSNIFLYLNTIISPKYLDFHCVLNSPKFPDIMEFQDNAFEYAAINNEKVLLIKLKGENIRSFNYILQLDCDIYHWGIQRLILKYHENLRTDFYNSF